MIPPHEMAERALQAAATARPALSGAIAIVTTSSRADLRWARTTLTTNGESREAELTVIGFGPEGSGVATATMSTSQPDEAGIDALLEAVVSALAQASAAEDAYPLVEPSNKPSNEAASDWTDEPEYASSGQLAPLAQPLGDLFGRCVADDIELFGYAEHVLTTTWLATSTGLRLRHAQPSARLELTAKSHARSRSTWWGRAAEGFVGIDLAPCEQSVRRALQWQGRSVEVPAGRHRALLTESAIGDLMVDLWWSASARQAIEGRSVFSGPGGSTRLGEKIGRSTLNLVSDADDPLIPASGFLAVPVSGESASVFDNGVEAGPVAWIRNGVLTGLHASRRLASDHGLVAAASPDTLRLQDEAGTGDIEDLIARTDEALLVTCLWYNRLVDPQTLLLTGLTRDGVYLVRDGEIVGATTNFRFNDSPVSVLDRIADAGTTRRTLPREMGDYAHRVAMPPVTVEDFNFSTISDAR